jgi:ATP-binding cassette subfamily B protein
MKSSYLPPSFASLVPSVWRQALQTLGLESENALACLTVDLDTQLRFAQQILIVTDRRLIALQKSPSGVIQHQSWPLGPGLSLSTTDHAGVGSLELINAQQRLAVWRFTLRHHVQAQFFQELFNQRCNGQEQPLEPLVEAASEEEAQAVKTWGLLRLWRFARPYQNQLLLGLGLTLASTAFTLVPPYMTMPLMDKVLIPYQNGQPIDPWLVSLYLSGLLVAAVLAWGLGWYKTYILALISERIGADLRTTTYEHLMRLSLEYFGGRRTGDLMARIGAETDRLCLFLSLHLVDFITDVVMITLTALILFSIDSGLALATLLPLPFIAWLIHQVRDRLRLGFEKIDRVWAELTNVLSDTIPGIRVVKAFAQEKREAQRFREANRHNLAVNDRVNFLWGLFTPTITLMTEIGLLVVWAFGIWQVSKNQVTVGVLAAFLAYIGRFYTRLDAMSRIVSHTQKAAAGVKRVFEILDHVSSVPEPIQPVQLSDVQGRIDIDSVGFRYGNRAVLRDFSLTIQPGEMIGLVGQSGSGKSTLINLICRFYDPTDGALRIDGVDIRKLAVSDYRRHIGLVLQEPFLFFGTIADNIAYGNPEATRQEIVAAARAAHAHDFILRLPQGYDSLVGERGQGLSGGERQRISIARALLINPRILILDEATSAVDTETEQEIQRALDNLVKGRTTIAIAHRLSTLQRADRLVVMEQGQLVEQGQHEELMQRKGVYWRLYEAQARQENDQLGGTLPASHDQESVA